MKPTQKKVIAWARESGGWQQWEARVMTPQVLERFAALAYEAGRKDENDACAKVCENMCGPIEIYNPAYVHYVGCAEAIRARGQHD